MEVIGCFQTLIDLIAFKVDLFPAISVAINPGRPVKFVVIKS